MKNAIGSNGTASYSNSSFKMLNNSNGNGNGNGTTKQLSKREELMLLKYTQLKLKRNLIQIEQLKKSLLKERIYSSTRSLNIIEFIQSNTDYLIPSIWGSSPVEVNQFKKYQSESHKQRSSHSNNSSGCCIIM